MRKFIYKHNEFEMLEYPLRQRLIFTRLGTLRFNGLLTKRVGETVYNERAG